MSHLNEKLSALIDCELSGAELDRVNAHLAACEQCRSEAATLRMLKRELRGLAATRPSEELTRKLLAMAGPGGPVPPRRHAEGLPRPRPAFRSYPVRQLPRRGDYAARADRSRPASRSPSDAWSRRKRGRYITVGALSLALTMAIGAVAADLGSGARMSPQIELYSIVHAFTGGSLPHDPGQPTRIKPTWGSQQSP
jgi:anti-sigma factor RsiW